ncbi:MAG: hypothetical protein D6835_01470 [Candidatus Thermofonsia bacterium]|nr:MAG: hypothetical protein D6835_01470 [Candidatus Thermofonsia bacterium]
MKKAYLLFLFLLLFLAACGQPTDSRPLATAVPTTQTTPLPPATATATNQPVPTATETAVPATATPIPPTITPQPDLALYPEDIYIYPVPYLYAGEKATFQVIADVPPSVTPEDVSVHILVDGTEVASGFLTDRTRGGDPQGLFKWVWDTTGHIGQHQVEITLDKEDVITVGDEVAENNTAVLAVPVLDPANETPAEANAVWVTAENDCCQVHVVTGTAAYRDLPDLLVTIDTAVQEAIHKLGEEPKAPLHIYLIDRVLGQGGYAGSIIVVSYSDRQYAANDLYQIMVHEAVHVLDRQFAPQRISFLAEGIAVWASGGHYKPEDVDTRAAAILRTGHYVPLAELVNNFYPIQHEIGYMEAAGFVNYLIKQRGWQQFKTFYTNTTAEDGATLAEALDANLQLYYGRTLEQAEEEWLAFLNDQPYNHDEEQDLETTLRYYNTMRHYQATFDPTAYFLTAWFPYPNEVLEMGNPADLSRHPEEKINLALETMLYAANQAMRAKNFNRANVILDSVERVLNNNGSFIDPLASSYLELVNITTEMGYEPQQITLTGRQAVVQATKPGSTALAQFNLQLKDDTWVLTN